MGENGVNGSIGFGGKRTWSYNENQKGIDGKAFELKAEDGAKKKEIKRLNKQNAVNKQLFNFFDRNKDGVLDQTELQNLRATINRTANSYSKGDGTIDFQEAEALYKFVEYDAKGVGSATLENLYNFLNTLNDAEGKDGIVSAQTDNDGVTTLDLGGGNYDKYQMKDVDGTPTKVLLERVNVDAKTGVKTTTKYEDGKLISVTEESNDATTEKNAEGKPVKITKKDGSSTTTFNYDKTPPTAEVKSGTSTITYALNQDGSVNTDKPLKEESFVARLGQNVVNTYTWAEDSVTVKNGEDGTTTVYGLTADGKLDEKNVISTDAKSADDVKDSEVQDKEYEVKKGETWYQIAAKEYKLTDHAEIMKAVHALKDQYDATKGRVGYNKNIGPQSVNGGKINLPASIQIGDKTVYLGGDKAVVAAQPVQDEVVAQPAQNPSKEEVAEADEESIAEDRMSITPATYPDSLYNVGIPKEGTPIYLRDGYGSVVSREQNTVKVVRQNGVSADMQLDETGTKVVKTTVSDEKTPGRFDIYGEDGAYTGTEVRSEDCSFFYNNEGSLTEFTKKGKYNGHDAVFTYNAEGKPTKIVVTIVEGDTTKTKTYEADPADSGKLKLKESE